MFSKAQKQRIAAAIEKVLLDIAHPEMPTERPRFHLHVDGKESWSWADIEPNWVYETGEKTPGVNPHNEAMEEHCGRKPLQPHHANCTFVPLGNPKAWHWMLGGDGWVYYANETHYAPEEMVSKEGPHPKWATRILYIGK